MKAKWRNWTFSFLLLMSSTILLSQKPQDGYGRLEIWLLWIINGAGSFEENNYILKQCIWQHWLGLGWGSLDCWLAVVTKKSLIEAEIRVLLCRKVSLEVSRGNNRTQKFRKQPFLTPRRKEEWAGIVFDEWVKLVKSTRIRGLKEESISASKTSRHKVKKNKKQKLLVTDTDTKDCVAENFLKAITVYLIWHFFKKTL